jgi:hypothetical protein
VQVLDSLVTAASIFGHWQLSPHLQFSPQAQVQVLDILDICGTAFSAVSVTPLIVELSE